MWTWLRRIMILACVVTPSATAQAQQQLAPVPSEPITILDGNAAPAFDACSSILSPDSGRFSIRGWLDGGYVYNASSPSSHFNGPYNSVYRSDEAMFNQAYLISEYLLPKDGSFGVGGRVDMIYGMDYFLAQSRGLETNPNGTPKWNSNQFYGFALPQIYGQVGTNDTNAKIGHFYSIVGYEGVQATGNFFYSKAYSYQFAGPFTHWGALGTTQLTENLQLQGGVHMGWDTLYNTSNHVSFIGGLKYVSSDKNWWSSFAITSGEDPTNLAGTPGISNGFSNRTRYSFIIDVKLTEKLEYVFHQWLGAQEDGTTTGSTALWYGIDQYMYYKINDQVKIGGRFEWFRDEDGTRVGLTLPDNPNHAPLPGTYFSATLGVNYSPLANLMIRPEARWDFATDTTVAPFNDGTRNNQFMLGVDIILKF